MTSIVGARINEVFLDLSTPQEHGLGDFFSVNSLNLILGRNGSGKTRLLLDFASKITIQNNEASDIYIKHNNTTGTATEESLSKLFAIYYSALPYRRKLSHRPRFSDASPRTQSFDDVGYMDQFQSVAQSLNVNTKLTGYVAYSNKLFRNILIPELTQVDWIADSALQTLLASYKKIRSSNSIEGSLLSYEKNKEQIQSSISLRLKSLIKEFFADQVEEIIHLSVLEYLYAKNPRNGRRLAKYFLGSIGVLSHIDEDYSNEKFETVIHNTRVISRDFSVYSWPDIEDTAYSFEIHEYADTQLIKSNETSIKINWSTLSSGLQALIEQFTLISTSIKKAIRQGNKNIILLIDEGDAYLHLEWQRKYISLLNEYLGSLKKTLRIDNLQVILASHSPLIAADFPGCLITNLDHGINPNQTFAAPIEDIIKNSFDSNSLGEFAAEKINNIYQKALKSEISEEDLRVIEEIGDFGIKQAITRVIKK